MLKMSLVLLAVLYCTHRDHLDVLYLDPRGLRGLCSLLSMSNIKLHVSQLIYAPKRSIFVLSAPTQCAIPHNTHVIPEAFTIRKKTPLHVKIVQIQTPNINISQSKQEKKGCAVKKFNANDISGIQVGNA